MHPNRIMVLAVSAIVSVFLPQQGGAAPPNTPTNVSPPHGATYVLPWFAILEASPYADPDEGDTHAASQWQVRNIANPTDYSMTVFDSGETTASLTSITVPSGILDDMVIYFWRVRYRDSSGLWSDWSSETVFLTQASSVGVPTETLDERTIYIRPDLSPSRSQMAVLTPGPNILRLYRKHRVEFPGYVETTSSTENAVAVTIRSVKGHEVVCDMVSFCGRTFPFFDLDPEYKGGSGAVFTVDTYTQNGANKEPVPFSDPVNLVIEFEPGVPLPNWDDVIYFDHAPATLERMRAVRDVIDGFGVDFEFILREQELNLQERTITMRNFRGLTRQTGSATYGAVAIRGTPAQRWQLYR